jgi:hypothetical protein
MAEMAESIADCVSRRECTALMANVQTATTAVQNSIGKDDQSGMRFDLRTIRETLSEMKGAEVERKAEAERQNQHHTNQLNEITTKIAGKSLTWTIAGVLISVAALALTVLCIIGSSWVEHHSNLSPGILLQPSQSRIITARNGAAPQDANIPLQYESQVR